MEQNLHAYFGMKHVQMIHLINTPIVTKVIGGMLWDPEDVNGLMHSNVIACFENCVGDAEVLGDSKGQDQFHVIIKNMFQLKLPIDYLQVGLSFHQAARVLQMTKK